MYRNKAILARAQGWLSLRVGMHWLDTTKHIQITSNTHTVNLLNGTKPGDKQVGGKSSIHIYYLIDIFQFTCRRIISDLSIVLRSSEEQDAQLVMSLQKRQCKSKTRVSEI